ncbi:MAG: aminotransferase class V-fold PLP-dependent enzyme [Bacteroidales bacterium]|nr:aminotransferase class V-fold PLP-dependent enzyme [Bacteroidales bacterium]
METKKSFVCDYSEGAHPRILERFIETNMVQCPGYGFDIFSESAKAKIREAIGDPDADIFFLGGGTQTNSTIISTMLKPFDGVVAVQTGHIAVHEAGAVEYTGHKVLTIPGKDGKMDAETLSTYLEAFFDDGNHDHMVFPGMAYISFPTEYGTIYSKAEIEAIHSVCRDYSIPLFIDGARMGYGLKAEGGDITITDLKDLCEVFYFGGTKVGALCGEAVVFPHHGAPNHFFTMVKQHGALFAKGRLLGIQFDTLFTDGLYLRIAEGAVKRAILMKWIFRKYGYPLHMDSPTNQQFIILTDEQMAALSEYVKYEIWEPLPDGRTVVRFATSWATTDGDIDFLEGVLKKIDEGKGE